MRKIKIKGESLMKIEYIAEDNKPSDWPSNQHEIILEQIKICVEQFEKEPTYTNREVLISLISQHDLNQGVVCGPLRVTEYEVGLINTLYLKGKAHQINSLITYLYDIVTQITRFYKIASWCAQITDDEDCLHIHAFEEYLILPMKFYHLAYQIYTVEKQKTFAKQLIEIVEILVHSNPGKEGIRNITYAYSAMLFDISNMHGRKSEKLWEFNREELFELLQLEAKLLKLNDQPANISPTKSVLMMQISNFILKSRHGYNEDYICKYLPKSVARESIVNHQIWMKKTELLNDDREQKVVPELFEDPSWIDYDWAKNIDFTATRTYYVSSFCKAINASEMYRDYGECLYGYKNDRIADLISPLYIRKPRKKPGVDYDLSDTKGVPVISQVITFDVLYNVDEAKDELRFLFSVIDMFDLSDTEKNQFLQEIMQYWILSVKDSKWQNEQERRYVIFLYDGYAYKEMEVDDTFLKVKTSLFIMPDFILGDNPSRHKIEMELQSKRDALFSNRYVLCEDCLMQDHDIAFGDLPDRCPICGSKKLKMIGQ